MRSPKISVIVPIYNAERHLRRCIDSILAQTFTDFEVLLINDGSTDESGCICGEYAKLDSRVRVFHKENGGVSSARNVGILNMIGEYSIHVDSDDEVSNEMLNDMYGYAVKGKFELVICDFIIVDSSKQKIIQQAPRKCNHVQVLCDILEGRLHGSVWNKLIKCQLIYDSSIMFNNEINYCEDVLFNAMVLQNDISIGYINKPYYNYCQDISSITNSASLNQIKNLPLYLNILETLIIRQNYKNIKKAFNIHVLRVKIILMYSGVLKYTYIKKLRNESNEYISYFPLNCVSNISLYSVLKGVGLLASCFDLLRKILNNLKNKCK